MLSILRVPGVMLAAFAIVIGALSIGFLSSSLEPHVRQVSDNFRGKILSLFRYIHDFPNKCVCVYKRCVVLINFQFNLSPVETGFIFVINGGVYAISAPGWGWLCDRINEPKYVTLMGGILITVGFLFIGPVPMIPLPT